MEPSNFQIAGALGGLGFPEILVIALVAILLFGGKKVVKFRVAKAAKDAIVPPKKK